jgi:uncharacterized repeat protein (TIGR04052 family)
MHKITCAAAFFLLAACSAHQHGSDGDMEPGPGADLGAPQVQLRFAARAGAQPFACGKTLPGLGKDGVGLRPADLRLYVHDVRLVTESGGEVPLTLDQDQRWQLDNLALLDFEDKSGECTGTAATNDIVRGTVPDPRATFTGVRFMLGVPFAKNHADQAAAPSPLNLSSMFWSWQSGYKFLRFEGQTDGGKAVIVHLGSTGCKKEGTQVSECTAPNRPQIELRGFDPRGKTILVDVAALLAGSDLGAGLECMSAPDSASCGPIFSRLGLPWQGAPGQQQIFRIE